MSQWGNPDLQHHLPDVLALSHVSEGFLHLVSSEHCSLQRLDYTSQNAFLEQLVHFFPFMVVCFKESIEQDPMEGDVFQEQSHAYTKTARAEAHMDKVLQPDI